MFKYQRLICILLGFGLLFLIGCVQRESSPSPFEEDEVAERDGMAKAMEQEFQMTVDPALGYVPKERLLKAQKALEGMLMSSPNRLEAISWQERGPVNVAGRTRAVIIDKKDATGNTVIAASVSGGIWKTTNFKSAQPAWTPVADKMGNSAVTALAQDPTNLDIIYAGTGEGWLNVDAVSGNGIWKSTDRGNNWTQITVTDSTKTGHNFDFIQDLVVNNQGVLFASARAVSIYGFGNAPYYCNLGGVLRSADGGATWARVIGKVTDNATCDSAYNFIGADLELAANGDIYATTGISNGGLTDRGRIFRSTAASNGTTWTEITPAGSWGRIEIACAPSDANRIYALMEADAGGPIGGIRRSSNAGVTWDTIPLPNWCSQGNSTNSDFTNGQAWYDLIAAVDPNNANTVVIGGIDLFKSTNGGDTWTQITKWFGVGTACNGIPNIHPDQHNVVFFPGSSTEFIVSNDGGVYYTPDGGTTFETGLRTFVGTTQQGVYSKKNIGYNVTQFYACAIHPTQSNYFLAGAQDNGTQQFLTTGVNNTIEASLGGDGGFCHIDQTDGNIQIASYVNNQFFYSRNNGQTFSFLNGSSNGRFINPSDYDNATKFLYTSNSAGLMGQLNMNGTGTPSFTSVTINAISGKTISAVKVDPTVSGGGTVWIAATGNTVTPTILKLTGANTTSPTVATNYTFPAALLPNRSYISSIDVDPANALHLLITVSNYGVTSIFESTNGGTSWTSLDNGTNIPDIPVRWGMFLPSSLSVDGTTPGGIMIATEIGVYYATQTAGSATSWSPQTNGLPNVRVDMLKYRGSDGLVAAATHGRGLFTTTLTKLTTGISPVPVTKDFIRYISPASDRLFIYTGNLGVQKIQIELLDMHGKLIYRSGNNYQNTSIFTGNLSKGLYILRVFGDHNEYYAEKFLR